MSIIEITEVHSYWDGDDYIHVSDETFVIDTDKIDADPDSFYYTKFIIEAARAGKEYTTSSRKFSFSDTDFEYRICKAEKFNRIDHRIEVQLNY